ncbi:MAG TPA: hypothetical protein DF613_10475 [Lachnospiraceae bacterium]|nr:hypothetical protein [Lachnospiraceae bacterium]
MKKWCAALLLAAFALLIPVMGMGQAVYATEGGTGGTGPGGEWEIVCVPNFGIGDEMQLFCKDSAWIYEEDSRWWDIIIRDVSGEDALWVGYYPLVISDIEAEGESITDKFLSKNEEYGAWVLDAEAGKDDAKDYEAELTITYGMGGERIDTDTLPTGITGEDIAEAVQKYIEAHPKKVKVVVSSDVYSLNLGTAAGRSSMVQGDSVELVAGVEREYLNKRGEAHYQKEISGAEFIWTARWMVEGTDKEGSISLSGTGNRRTVTAPEMEDDSYIITYHVDVKVPGKDEPVASADGEPLEVRKELYVLEPEELAGAADLWVGDSLTVTPKVWHYKTGGIREEVNDVKYTFSYGENFAITDSSGKTVPPDSEDEIAYQNAGTFTIKRLADAGEGIGIYAHIWVPGEDAYYDQIATRYWWISDIDYDARMSITGGRNDSHSWLFVDDEDPNEDETAEYTLDIGKIPDSLKIEWNICLDDGSILKATDAAPLFKVSGERGETVTIEAKPLKEYIKANLGEDNWMGFTLQAFLKEGEEVKGSRYLNVSIETPTYTLEDQETDSLVIGESFRYDDGIIRCYVTNKEYPEGRTVELQLAAIEVEDEPELDGPPWKAGKDGDDFFLEAVSCGSAAIKYTVIIPNRKENDGRKTFTERKWVSDELYRLNVESSTGSMELLSGENLKLAASLVHVYYDEAKKSNIRRELDPEEYTVTYRVDENDADIVSVDADGTVTVKDEDYCGSANIRVTYSVLRGEGEDPWMGEEYITVWVEDCYYEISAGNMTAAPGESVDAIDWEWIKYDADNQGGVSDGQKGSCQLRAAKGIRRNADKTGFTVNDDVADGTEIEIWLDGVRRGANGNNIEKSCCFVLTVCRHDFRSKKIDTPATCVKDGSETVECTKCHKTTTRTIPATGKHTPGEWTTTKQPTAAEAGERVQKCTVCGEVVNREAVPALGADHQHTAGEWTTTKQPTCKEEGVQEQRCKECGAVLDTRKLPVTAHSFGDWTETKKATVLEEGTRTRTCTVCGATETANTEKVKAVIKLNVKSIPLQVKKSTTAVKVVSMGAGDAVKSWKSSNSRIVSVSNKGKITGKKVGTAKVTVTLKSGVSAKVTVKVQKKAVATKKVTVTGKDIKKNKVTLKKGKSVTLTVEKNPVTSTDKVTYKSSDKKVATVSGKGKITAKKAGTAKITVKAGKKKAVITVQVKK